MARYAMIMAGGSGTRLWPMSRKQQPKQLIPFLDDGKSLIEAAWDRLDGLVPDDNRLICAGLDHRDGIAAKLGSDMKPSQFLAEPVGRDTLNAVGFGAAVLAQRDPQAVMGVFTADHLIRPVDVFQETVNRGFELAESDDRALVTFGITPTRAETGFGYLQLGEAVDHPTAGARVVDAYREKPDADTAQQFLDAGPDKFLWSSGMFAFKASTMLRAIEKFAPENYAKLMQIARAWQTPEADAVLQDVYPTLKKISIDFAVMEPASTDDDFNVAAVPMSLSWLDIGSWPAFAEICKHDDAGNALAAVRHLLQETKGTLVASSDPNHLIATIGCENLLIIHTPEATLVCNAEHAQAIKQLHADLCELYGDELA